MMKRQLRRRHRSPAAPPMKRQKSYLKSSELVCSELDLPDDCWERIFRLVKNSSDDDDDNLKSLSVVSKHFLSVTNRHRFSLSICYPTLPFLPCLLQRFTKLTSLDLSSCWYYTDYLNNILIQISSFQLNHLTSLNLSNQSTIPAIGLRVFSENITTLTSLICSNIRFINSSDFNLIADCFPLLEELDLSNPKEFEHNNHPSILLGGLESLSFALFKLRKVNLSRHYYINDKFIFHLFKNCKFLQEAIMLHCYRISNHGIASALCERPTLRSLSHSPFLSHVIFSSSKDQNYYDATFVTTSHFIESLLSLKGLTCLDLSGWRVSDQLLSSIAMQSLPLRRLHIGHCTGYSYDGIFCLLSSKSQRFQHLGLQNADFLNDSRVADLSFFLPDLVSIDLSYCTLLTDSSLFALLRNYPSLSEIILIGCTSIAEKNSLVEISNSLMEEDCVVNPQFKYLRLASILGLQNQKIIMFASIFPNLHLLDLSHCWDISEEGIGQVLRRCRKIRHLNLMSCSRVKSLGISNFELPKLEVLNFSDTRVDDKALYVISKRCLGLLQLSMRRCLDITNKGVMHVVKNCMQLREINLCGCDQVRANVVACMVFLRPSLRKITTPPDFPLTERNRKLFSHHGCLLGP